MQTRAMSGLTNSDAAPAIKAETPPLHLDENGIILVTGTRVALDSLVSAFQRGETPEEIARNYDAVSLGQVYQAIGFYLAHQAEMEGYLERRRDFRATVKREVEAQHNPVGIRDRLLARRKHSV